MAFIRYVDDAELSSADRVPDTDNILQIHGVHPAVMQVVIRTASWTR